MHNLINYVETNTADDDVQTRIMDSIHKLKNITTDLCDNEPNIRLPVGGVMENTVLAKITKAKAAVDAISVQVGAEAKR